MNRFDNFSMIFFALLILLFNLPLSAQIIFQQPLSHRIANYGIRVSLDTETHTLTGQQTLRWRNTSTRPVEELRFHLYMNAFRNHQSTFLSEPGGRGRFGFRGEYKFGGIDILECQLSSGEGLLDSIAFIQPDDGNVHDSTVIRIGLPRPILPGQSIELQMKFETRLPEIIARTGYKYDYYLIGQWFPKIGVLQEDGSWNCHQFHRNSEFFSDFGVYQVEITLPVEYVVGATGVRIQEEKNDSLQTLTFRAEDVHDFAWTAWPHFRVETRDIEGVEVTLLYDLEHRSQVERYFHSIQGALKLFGEWFMPYPYPNLTIVDPPIYGMASAGMEYPTFIVGGALWEIPEGLRLFPEEVTIHEFGHQYFYGILANNEFEEAWLDEGMNTYATARAMSQLYGRYTSIIDFLGIAAGEIDLMRQGYIRFPERDVIVKPSWKFELGGYGVFVYYKPGLMLLTLENYLGETVMQQIWKTYFQRFQFRHPTTHDFIQVVNEIAPENMDWFFQQALFDTRVLDYAVKRISNKRISEPDDSTAQQMYKSKVILYRNGDFIFPVEALVRFEGGDSLFVQWGGQERYRTFEFERPEKVISAEIDPYQKVLLDVNMTNNSLTIEKPPSSVWKLRFNALHLYQTVLNLFSF